MTITTDRLDIAEVGDRPQVKVLIDRCAGCQECVVRCPEGALSMDLATWTVSADSTLCVGCRQCERTCPFAAIAVEGTLLVAPRVSIPLAHPEQLSGNLDETRPGIDSWSAALAEASRCLGCPDPTCVRGCPVHNDIPGFVKAISEGDLDEAHQVLRRTTFLPDVCSRVCDQALQCEGACTWSLAGGTPVAIGALERFVADHAAVPPLEKTSDRGRGLSIAVVGSGPAGIGAAFELARSGASVTVFEKAKEPGGLLDWGIPDFTLPKRVARRPWETLARAGVTLNCGSEVSADRVASLLDEHDAVVLAHGAGVPLRLPVAGGDLDGICDATAFLHEARASLSDGRPFGLLDERDRTVLVLGAGNTAMDVARLARRLGHRAICVDWMDARYAPVRPDELTEAAVEGVEIRFNTTLERLEGVDGRVVRAVLSQTEQKAAGKLPKVVAPGCATQEVDLVVMAMGYRLDPSFSGLAPSRPIRRQATGLMDRKWQASGIFAGGSPEFARHQPVGMLAAGREVGRLSAGLGTSDRVWVVGDALVGPSTVVEAMAQGRQAAQAILDQRPSHSTGHDPSWRPAVLVACESRSGHTDQRGRDLAAELERRGAAVELRRLAEVGLSEIAAVDLVVVGTWVEGFVVAGVQPARATRDWLARLPGLGARKFATFCTYAVAPRGSLGTLRRSLEANGGSVVAEAAFGPSRHGSPAVEPFAAAIMAAMSPEPQREPAGAGVAGSPGRSG